MEARSSRWPARFALLISVLMFGALIGPFNAFGQTSAQVPVGLATSHSASGSGSGSPSTSASSSPSATCSIPGVTAGPSPLCRTPSSSGSGSPSGSGTPSGSPTGGGEETHASEITITYGNDKFSGAVKSDADCKPKRKVIVRKIRKGPDLLIGKATTNNRGRWSVAEADAARGRYYAKVLKRVYTILDTAVTCRGDRSPVVRVV